MKTLNNDEIQDLKFMIKNVSDDKIIDNYVMELVYGNKEFNNFGTYYL